jgi:hypothetical protein
MARTTPPIAFVLTFLAALLAGRGASALIEGGEGNAPFPDPGWPQGAAAVFNVAARAAYWEGPPFGGGQSHAECRGDAKQFNAVLVDFAKIAAKKKRLILHDGVGQSFWLNTNGDAAKKEAAKIDWVFVVWQQRSWNQLQKLPLNLRAPTPDDGQAEPAVQIDVYTGGSIKWADVVIPKGIDIIDERLEAHGYKTGDGTVFEGTITDLKGKPLDGEMDLQLMEPSDAGYTYTSVEKVKTDDKGRWVLKYAPGHWYRILARADGFVPRVMGYAAFDGAPGWHFYKGQLATPTAVSGRVVDDAGKPLADVDVSLDDVVCNEEVYKTLDNLKAKTDADGKFHIANVPVGSTRVFVGKQGYCRPGLGESINTPANDLKLTMLPSAQIRVAVDFADKKRPEGYIVELEPQGGNVVGSWGGSGNINEQNEIIFSDAPPGKYFIWGHPNPSSTKDHTPQIIIEAKGGATVEVTLKAK